ncbi:VOC family protein [Micromonospora chersina]|uniref:VOC family protein n=1 Tax=Micromonospora chersina TaxID=47854 RepID=UPI00371DFA87
MSLEVRAHYSLCVQDLDAAVDFYTKVLGGAPFYRQRNTCHVSLEGHHLVLHQVRSSPRWAKLGEEVSGAPIPHFGIIVDDERYERILSAASADRSVLIAPKRRRRGTALDHICFFVADPSGYPWEIKRYVGGAPPF